MKTVFIGGGTGVLAPSVFSAAIQSAYAGGLQPMMSDEDPILVVVQLSGGNDGLNSVVPFGNDDYYRARSRLAIKPKTCLRIDDETGLHPSLRGLKSLYDDGLATIVQGVGYPNPNRSHFRSMEIWHTASDAGLYETHGWLGRYFDVHGKDLDASVGIALGKQPPQAFAAALPKGLSFKTPEELSLRSSGRGRAMDESRRDAWESMNGIEDQRDDGASIGDLAGASLPPGLSPIDFLEQTARDARQGAETITQLLRTVRNEVSYPRTPLGRDCALVSKLISGKMPTRVYYVSHGGFDTHTNQAGTHDRLLRQFGDAMKSFVTDLRKQGNLQRVLILVFSEFGRRVQENANSGTDHGAAGPLFVCGGLSKGGVLGVQPCLHPSDLIQGDLRHQFDFRSIYATVLESHMQVEAQPILRKRFPVVTGLFSA